MRALHLLHTGTHTHKHTHTHTHARPPTPPHTRITQNKIPKTDTHAHAHTHSLPELREAVAAHSVANQGIPCDALTETLITCGELQPK